MLKITQVVLASQEITLRLDGRVTGQWVELLRNTAESLLEAGLRLNIDLTNVSYSDCEGIALLKSLIDRGVRHLNAPLFVAEKIRKCRDAQTGSSNGEQ
ncbi:MAG TPA: STAS domain-containing protein [Pyrinomonadaceae bacterium]|nr:STAS domain-containing protein [Pyrinomonadaceae bacterium]